MDFEEVRLLWISSEHPENVRNSSVVTTADSHAAGEPNRIIGRGAPDISGSDMREKKMLRIKLDNDVLISHVGATWS